MEPVHSTEQMSYTTWEISQYGKPERRHPQFEFPERSLSLSTAKNKRLTPKKIAPPFNEQRPVRRFSTEHESSLSSASSASSDSNQSGGSAHGNGKPEGSLSRHGNSSLSRGASWPSPTVRNPNGLSRLMLHGSADKRGLLSADDNGNNGPLLKRKRPPKLEIPAMELNAGLGHCGSASGSPLNEVKLDGSFYAVYSKRGKGRVLEDSYEVIPEVGGDVTQALFGVYDGHGGRKAADYVAQHLARNIIGAMAALGDHDEALGDAVRHAYLRTDRDFLQEGASSGASCVTSVMKGGNLVVAHAGDCRAVLCRKGVAEALTEDHRASREDEKERIERLGGLVDCCSGVWRVQNTLTVSRGIGDLRLKEYITAEPDVRVLPLTPDCEFLILASDGLWDVVSNKEAVDAARPFLPPSSPPLRSGPPPPWPAGPMAACERLIEMSVTRGCPDDVSVVIICLDRFRPALARACSPAARRGARPSAIARAESAREALDALRTATPRTRTMGHRSFDLSIML